MRLSDSAELRDFAEPARLRNQVWRLFVGCAVICACCLVWIMLVFLLGIVALMIGSGISMTTAFREFEILVAASAPSGVLLILLSSVGVWIGIWAATNLLHGRPFKSVISAERRVRWAEFSGGVGLAMLFWLVSALLGYLVAGAPVRSALAVQDWLIVLAPLVALAVVQSAGEEMVFRGYILQQLAARFPSVWMWAVLPAVCFGLFHFDTSLAPTIRWVYVASSVLFALTLTVLVWRTGSLSASIGLHTGINLFSLSIVGVQGSLDGSALWRYRAPAVESLFYVDLVLAATLLVLVLSPYCPIGRRGPVPLSLQA